MLTIRELSYFLTKKRSLLIFLCIISIPVFLLIRPLFAKENTTHRINAVLIHDIEGRVTDYAISPNGKLFAFVIDKKLSVHDLDDNNVVINDEEIVTPGFYFDPSEMYFTSDSNKLVIFDSESYIKIWRFDNDENSSVNNYSVH